MNTIKETLIEAGRYEEIKKILKNIIFNIKDIQLPVNPFAGDGGKIQYYVKGCFVKEEAAKLFIVLTEKEEIEMQCSLDNLFKYVHSYACILMHNYANMISHRKNPELDVSMEDIRCWEILDNFLACYIAGLLESEDEDGKYEWSIPDGWKKQ